MEPQNNDLQTATSAVEDLQLKEAIRSLFDDDTEKANECLSALNEELLPDLPKRARVQPKTSDFMEYTRYKLPVGVTLQNIYSFINADALPHVNVGTTKTMTFMINQLDTVTDLAGRKALITVLIHYFVTHFQDILQTPSMIMLLKMKFDDFIVRDKMHHLVPLYNKVFNDHLYDNVSELTTNFEPTIPIEVLNEFALQYNERVKTRIIQQNRRRLPPKYEINELVGARDVEGKWRPAIILAKYTYDNKHVYYVDFPGFPAHFREFIIETKIEVFNPKKHRYAQRAIRRVPITETLDNTATNDNAMNNNSTDTIDKTAINPSLVPALVYANNTQNVSLSSL